MSAVTPDPHRIVRGDDFGWQAQTLISNPMSVHPKYARIRSLWMGGGQAVENGAGAVGRFVIHHHQFARRMSLPPNADNGVSNEPAVIVAIDQNACFHRLN